VIFRFQWLQEQPGRFRPERGRTRRSRGRHPSHRGVRGLVPSTVSDHVGWNLEKVPRLPLNPIPPRKGKGHWVSGAHVTTPTYGGQVDAPASDGSRVGPCGVSVDLHVSSLRFPLGDVLPRAHVVHWKGDETSRVVHVLFGRDLPGWSPRSFRGKSPSRDPK